MPIGESALPGFRCDDCGHTQCRDLNAAINIEWEGLRLAAEGAGNALCGTIKPKVNPRIVELLRRLGRNKPRKSKGSFQSTEHTPKKPPNNSHLARFFQRT
ncbi:hypothetical protein [Methylomicrobium album]|uniref:hypothetical protein n=1 Tax=Methylomicrobium TaxID=39773 RepID=UPI003CCABA97